VSHVLDRLIGTGILYAQGHAFQIFMKGASQRENESAWQARSSQPGCGVSARIEMEAKETRYTDGSSQLAMRSFNGPKWR
jgi:hypothetical protein